MKSRVACAAFIAGLIVLAPAVVPVGAWGAQGHHIVARIAWALMAPAAREHASALLDGGGMDAFVASATWADDVRSERPGTYNWHFVNIPVSEGHYDAARHCPPTERGDCVVAETARLRADRRRSSSSSTSSVTSISRCTPLTTRIAAATTFVSRLCAARTGVRPISTRPGTPE
jgi:hypothetical protein